ncbi:hypothetical protein [Actinoplanes sp. GCM10030250]|uniref:hypothetical protein n=1 Tax=Actinoplanes sp. GCM10030250 TaxID=3273376 RepID=UPI00362416C1
MPFAPAGALTPPLRIGYSFWGFLTTGVIDTPDGARSFRRAFVDALQEAGHEVVSLQVNRDLIEAGTDLASAYRFDEGLPDLDAIVFEWRWPLPGRNTTVCGTPGHTCDLHRQQQLLDHYTHGLGLPTVVWDHDLWLPARDPLRRQTNVRVAEPALHPSAGAITVTSPIPDEALDIAAPSFLARLPRPLPLVYVGNQYGRDEAFDRWFAPAAAQMAHRVAGKWTNTSAWPHVQFTGRIRFAEVAGLHAQALTTVLLKPERYRTVGAFGSRLFESVTQGCLPVTPADTVGADRLTPKSLHVRDAAELVDRIRWIESIAGTDEHASLIRACLDLLDPYRISRQAAVLLAALHDLAGTGRPDHIRSR